jgi:hypothetical protein
MSGEHPKWVGQTLDTQAFGDRKRHAPSAHRYGKELDTQAIEREKSAIREQDKTEKMQRLKQLGIVLAADGTLDTKSVQYVLVVKKRARIIGFFDTYNTTLNLSYEETPKKVFRANIFSENLSADNKESVS